MPILEYIKNGTQYGFLKKSRKFLYGILHLELLIEEGKRCLVLYLDGKVAVEASKLYGPNS